MFTHYFGMFPMLIIFIAALIMIARGDYVDKGYNFKGPEIFMNVTQIIKYQGYPCEDHEAVTEDGYILSLQRIPRGRGANAESSERKPVVFLQHGLVDSSFTWVNNLPHQSLGFILADSGYDVWLGNSRGNKYSRKHKTLKETSREFWDFSWDEMAKYDLPTSIDYVLNYTKASKLSYVGHSQGSEIAFAKLSENGPLNSKISSFVALAPVAYVGHIRTAIRYLSVVSGGINLMFQVFNHGEFIPNNLIISLLAKYVCGNSATYLICSNVLFLITGYNYSSLNTTRLPVYLAHMPAGTSVKNMVHYSQGYESDNFQMYDRGLFGNLYEYGRMTPPKYKVNTHGVPVGLFYGGNDWLADETDVTRIIDELGDDAKYMSLIPYYNHIDFIWGQNAAEVVYKDLINFIRRYQ